MGIVWTWGAINKIQRPLLSDNFAEATSHILTYCKPYFFKGPFHHILWTCGPFWPTRKIFLIMKCSCKNLSMNSKREKVLLDPPSKNARLDPPPFSKDTIAFVWNPQMRGTCLLGLFCTVYEYAGLCLKKQKIQT